MSTPLTIKHHFRKVKDPRINRHKRHALLDIIVVALCAVLCGAKDWQQIEAFGKQRLSWFRRFLLLANGIPSHDTFERVFDRIDPRAFHQGFQSWMAALLETLDIKHVAIDGKTLRGSSRGKLGALHVVSAFATAYGLSLGQVATSAKSNEITAIPELLELLQLHGAVVSIDAMGCQKAIASKILERGGDYVLMVKDNQPTLCEDIRQALSRTLEAGGHELPQQHYSTQDRGHGRVEKRHYTILTDLEGIRQQEDWKGLRVVGMCVRERQVGQQEPSIEVSFFIGSKAMSVKRYAQVLRHHWSIENNLHWQLDVTFAEDKSRVSKRHAAENLALLRRLALTMLKRHPSKLSMAGKQWNAALNPQFLEEVLAANANSGGF
ncbi:MAG TPA: ISAs1 family transposase [Gemmataceae bacterium]|nr:ISAs1 family transposase [Gemmataceae bacterium]